MKMLIDNLITNMEFTSCKIEITKVVKIVVAFYDIRKNVKQHILLRKVIYIILKNVLYVIPYEDRMSKTENTGFCFRKQRV